MSGETKRFHVSDILSITTGKLVSTRHLDGVADLLNWMTDDVLFTHQLPRASEECEEPLRRQFPALAEIVAPEWSHPTKEDVLSWVKGVETEHGSFHEVFKLSPGVHEIKDPVEELIEKMGPDRVITVIPEQTQN